MNKLSKEQFKDLFIKHQVQKKKKALYDFTNFKVSCEIATKRRRRLRA